MVKICIIGLEQCGSTRLFNLVRLVYEKVGKSVESGWEKTNSSEEVLVSKFHIISSSILKNFDIILLPIRNILDAAVSHNKRFNTPFKKHCMLNLKLYQDYKNKATYIFKYEDYSVFYIKKLCDEILHVSLTYEQIIDIMNDLDKMLNSKSIIPKDDHDNKEYQKTLLSQHHNTSGGKINKFIDSMPKNILIGLIKNRAIKQYLIENNYF